MRTYFLFILTLFSVIHITAQNSHTVADSSAIFSIINTAEIFFTNGNYDSALFYCRQAEDLSKQRNFKKGQAYALIEATDVYIDKDDLDKAQANAIEVNKIGLQLRDSLITAITWMQMAQVKMYSNLFDDAIPLFEKSLQYYLSKHPTRYSALAYNDLGYTWGRKGDLGKQATYLIQSIGIYEAYFPDQYGELAVAFNNLSTVYYSLNQREKAIEYAKQSLLYREKTGDVSRLSLGCCNISQFYIGINNEEAEKYLQLCVKYALQSKLEARIIHSYVTAAQLYSTNKKPVEALEFELKAIALLEKDKKNPAMLARRYLAAGNACRQLKKDSATIVSYYNKSYELLKSLPDKITHRDFYFQLYNFYDEQKNDAAAYENYRKYVLYKDSVISEKTQSSIAEIATRYETEKKDNELKKLYTEQRIRQLEIEKQKAVIAGNLLLAKQKENEIKLLSQQQELQEVAFQKTQEELEKQLLLAKNNEQAYQLSQQQLRLSISEKELREKELKGQKLLRNIVIAGVVLLTLFAGILFNRYKLKKKLEQQQQLLHIRNDISSNLHDDIGASLSNINILNELTKRNVADPEKAKSYLAKAGDDIQRISESLSDIVWNINPQYDDLDHLFIRMKRYAADILDGKEIAAQLSFPSDMEKLTMPMDQRRDFYLIFKEAVNNLVKYSKATEAIIKVHIVDQQIHLKVTDNGKGFDLNNTRMGNGVQNMKQRADKWSSSLLVQSEIGMGTTILLTMKINV